MGSIVRELAGYRVGISTHGHFRWTQRSGRVDIESFGDLFGTDPIWGTEYSWRQLEHPANLAKIERWLAENGERDIW